MPQQAFLQQSVPQMQVPVVQLPLPNVPPVSTFMPSSSNGVTKPDSKNFLKKNWAIVLGAAILLGTLVSVFLLSKKKKNKKNKHDEDEDDDDLSLNVPHLPRSSMRQPQQPQQQQNVPRMPTVAASIPTGPVADMRYSDSTSLRGQVLPPNTRGAEQTSQPMYPSQPVLPLPPPSTLAGSGIPLQPSAPLPSHPTASPQPTMASAPSDPNFTKL
jgi:hypothetical protein